MGKTATSSRIRKHWFFIVNDNPDNSESSDNKHTGDSVMVIIKIRATII